MTTSSAESPKVFISYTHDSPEHMDRVLELANRLRAEGVDCRLDQYETSPPEGWPRWAAQQIEEADYVLSVFTEANQRRFKGAEEAGKGRGAQWEGAIITQELYDAAGDNAKFIPVLFTPEDSDNIPHVLRGVSRYDLSSEEGYTELYRRLTNQPRVVRPELGRLVPLPTRERRQFFFNSWNVPHAPNPFFTGREDALGRLHEALEAKGTAAVSGMPGVGKTQTAVEYAHRHRSEYKLIFWARAETRETLISDFVNIAGVLQLPEVRAQEQNLAVGAVRRWFDANPDWLLVLDNADDLALAREFMPSAPKGRIILTTRAQATGAIAANVEVLKMEDDEGALFLLRRAKILAEDAALESAPQPDREKAQEITREVDGLPLALDQAGAFIEESSSSPAEYLDLYKTQGAYLRSQRGELAADHPESVAITFSLSFDKVAAASPTAADLLRACAFLAPDAIPEEIFTEGGARLGELLAATVNNPLALLNAIKETRRYSLLRRDPDARTLSIHRVVQDVLKDEMDESNQRQWAERIISTVNLILPDFDETDFSEWHRFERLLPHAQECARLVERWGLEFPEAAHLLNNAARYMHNRSRMTEAEPLYLHALSIRENLHGSESPEVAISLYNLGWLKHNQGKYAEAEPILIKALEIRRNILVEDDIAIAESEKQLGWLKYKQGKYSEAKTYFQQAINKLGEASALNGNILADALHGLAGVLIQQARYDEAEPLLARSLIIAEAAFKGGVYLLPVILRTQGILYRMQGQHLKAETFLMRSQGLVENIYGRDHPYVASLLNELAVLHINQNKLPEGEKLLFEVLAIRERLVDRDHPEVGSTLHNLAFIYAEQNDFAKAEEFYLRACEVKEKSLDSNHPDLANSFVNLAVLYSDYHKYVDAETLFRKSIAILKNKYPPEHPDLLRAQENYAVLLRRMNRKGEAQKLEGHVKKMRAKQGRKKPKR